MSCVEKLGARRTLAIDNRFFSTKQKFIAYKTSFWVTLVPAAQPSASSPSAKSPENSIMYVNYNGGRVSTVFPTIISEPVLPRSSLSPLEMSTFHSE